MRLFGWVLLLVIVVSAITVLGGVIGYFERAASVVGREVDPAAIEAKYEWFKDAAAALDAKRADIAVYDQRFVAIGGGPGRCPTASDRVAREECMVWAQEEAGIVASYNATAAEYNAEMAKWNWRFANVGSLPAGAVDPLPREFKPYAYQ